MKFSVPAGNALVFIDADGGLLETPLLHSVDRDVTSGPDAPAASV
ncbi:hypothetical protein CLV52_0552 [Amnibacterium kyonggiense]|uniref:Uncharacterized protein n=1 Tax=Amnibacterium kyonggiense TaxID=595671 RepID=A0A4V3EB19_9MICO|nr:hypothetical protein CLV52_0552 [Amnibacterium kyonggiense]